MGLSVGGLEYFLSGLELKTFLLFRFNPWVGNCSKSAPTFLSGPVQCPQLRVSFCIRVAGWMWTKIGAGEISLWWEKRLRGKFLFCHFQSDLGYMTSFLLASVSHLQHEVCLPISD